MSLWHEQLGFAVTAPIVQAEDMARLIDEAERLFGEDGRRAAGVRAVLGGSGPLAAFAASDPVMSLVTPILGDNAFVARSILFDKSPDANWDVAWHQDTTISVVERAEVPGFGPWSVKGGVPHVRPTREILEAMLTVRIHLDVCDESNGALLVAPGSHRDGIVIGAVDVAPFEQSAVPCVTPAGGAVLMRPLLFHASRKADRPTHRRVLHLEFAAGDLPAPLRWART